MKRSLIIYLPLFALIAFVVGCQPTATPSDESEAQKTLVLEYKSTTYPFEFKTPDGWLYQENYANSAVTAKGPTDELGHYPSVNVIVADADPTLLDAEKEQMEEILKAQGSEAKLTHFEKTTLGGHEALRFSLTTQVGEMASTQEQYMLNAGQHAYIITCSTTSDTFPALEETFKSILNSFVFR
jgi:hypothetical protein